jgi:hypothetical protein
MEPARVRGGSTRAPLIVGALVLASVVAVGAGPHLLGTGAQPYAAPLASLPSASRVASPAPAQSVAQPASLAPAQAALPSYPPPAAASSQFWVEVRRDGHVLQRSALLREPDGSRTGTIEIPIAWRRKLPIVALFGRTVPENHPSRLFSIRLALPDIPRLGPAVNLAGGLSVIIDPIPAPTGSFDPGPAINYIHTWSYSADLQWAFGGGPQLVVRVAPQLGV